MKYLNKFNESTIGTKEIDLEYIDMCFVDFIDDGFKFEFVRKDNNQAADHYELNIKLRDKHRVWEPNNIDDYVDLSDKMREIFHKIKECVEKVKIQYPDLEYSVGINKKSSGVFIIYLLP